MRNVRASKDSDLRRKFNITHNDYDKINKLQDGKCFICGKPAVNKALAVDHDHKTGLIRGLLCMRHNRAIAGFSDNPAFLRRAVEYLEDPPATKALGAPRYGLKGRSSSKKKTLMKNNPEWYDKDGNRIFPKEVTDQLEKRK